METLNHYEPLFAASDGHFVVQKHTSTAKSHTAIGKVILWFRLFHLHMGLWLFFETHFTKAYNNAVVLP